MSRKSPALKALEEKYTKALATIETMSLQQASLAGQLATVQPRVTLSGQLVVGVRNISNYTVGLVDGTGGAPVTYTLSPELPGVLDPNTRAVVSYAFWQKLRMGKQVAQGLIMRDDSPLGDTDMVAPPDRPGDIHPDAEVNTVLDPRVWITETSEADIREHISRMTSGPTLRRLMYAVDQEVINLGEPYAGQVDRAEKAIRALPAVFRLVEELATERLDQLNPISAVRHLERGDLQTRNALAVR